MIKNSKMAFLLAGLASSLLSCQKEDEPIDLEAPKISLSVSGRAEKLYNLVTLSSSVTDNDSITRVEFFLNEESLGEDREAPYELQWNSKDVEDGKYLLKAVGQDVAGNVAEAAQEVTVKNTLFVVNVEDGYIKAEEGQERKIWYYLSDKEGKVVGEPQQLVNGQSSKWERPANFYSDTVHLNVLREASFTDNPNHKYLSLYTYTNFSLYEVNYKASEPSDKGEGVETSLTIENDFDGTQYYSYNASIAGTHFSAVTPNNSFTFSKNLHEAVKVFSTYGERGTDHMTNRERFYLYHDLTPGEHLNIHTSDFIPMEGGRTIKVPFEYDYLVAQAIGYKADDTDMPYTVDNPLIEFSETNEFKLFYSDLFPDYKTVFRGRKGNKRFRSHREGLAPETYNMPAFSVSVITDDVKHIQVTNQGTFDIGNGFWESQTETAIVRRGIYFGSDSGITYIMADVPASLLKLHPELDGAFKFLYNWSMDYTYIGSHKDVLNYWFSGVEDNVDYEWNYDYKYIYAEKTNGRLLPTKPVDDEMEPSIQESRGESDLY